MFLVSFCFPFTPISRLEFRLVSHFSVHFSPRIASFSNNWSRTSLVCALASLESALAACLCRGASTAGVSALKCTMHKFAVDFTSGVKNYALYTEQCSLSTVKHMGVFYGRFSSKTLCFNRNRLTTRHVETRVITQSLIPLGTYSKDTFFALFWPENPSN